MAKKNAWYKQTWGIILILILFFPVGVFLLWRYGKFQKKGKMIATLCFGVLFLASISNSSKGDDSVFQPVSQIEAESTQSSTEMPTETEKKDESDTENNTESEPATTEKPIETTEQEETAEPETTEMPTELETTEPEEIAESETEEVMQKNILLDTKLKVGKVMNGAGTEQLGKYGYIEITKEELKSVTMEDYDAFYNECVSGSGYNWVSIICEDGTGICFPGSSIYASYGKLDTDGAILETYGSIDPNFDGTYVYNG